MTDLLLLNELNIDSHGTKFNLYYDLFFFCLNEKLFAKSALIHFMYYSIICTLNEFFQPSGVNVQKTQMHSFLSRFSKSQYLSFDA